MNVKSVLQNTVLCCFATGIVCTPFRSALADGTAAHDFDPLDVLIPIIATSADDPWRNRSLWERYAPYCPEATIGGIDVPKYPSKPSAGNECNDGDMTLFNGLLCASGDDRGCDGVKRAQSPDGRFWRSPRRALTNNGGLGDSDDSKSFSPDMSLGVLLYVAKTGDTHALSTWLKWIEEHRPCIARQEDVNWIAAHCYCYNDLYMQLMCSIGWVPRCSPQNQCVIRGLPQLCTATDCIMRPWDADMMRETAHAFGVDAQTGIEHYNDIAIDVLHNPYYAGFLGDLVKQIIYQTHIIQIITALAGTNDIEMVLQTYLDMDIASKMLFNTVVNEPGYPQHLEGIRVEILRMLNRGDQATLNEVARVLAEKETNNPFFAYLDEGPSSAVRDLTVDLCPATPEDIGDRSEWAWERTDAEKAWEKSMLWDCIFMSNFYE